MDFKKTSKSVDVHTINYPSHFTVDKLDEMIEYIPWTNGEGADLIISNSNETQYISIGDTGWKALQILLKTINTD